MSLSNGDYIYGQSGHLPSHDFPYEAAAMTDTSIAFPPCGHRVHAQQRLSFRDSERPEGQDRRARREHPVLLETNDEVRPKIKQRLRGGGGMRKDGVGRVLHI